MTLDDLKLLGNQELLDLYAKVVEIDHYDPYVTPKFYHDLCDNGITQSVIQSIIIERMK